MKRDRFRLAHLVSHPVPYFAPLYREIASRPEIDLTVYFYSDETLGEFYHPSVGRTLRWDTPMLGGYEHRLLPSASRTRVASARTRRPNVDIVREVASSGYDAIWVHGYDHPTTWLAVAAARAKGIPVLVRDEQTLLDQRRGSKRVIRDVALRAFLSNVTGLYIGEQNRRFLRRYGVPESRMFAARYCVDNEFFARRADELVPRRRELRVGFGITNDAPVVLFTGRMVEKKRPLLLLEAFARVRKQLECSLLVAGDGPLRAAAESFIAQHSLADVHFAGFLNQQELPDAYGAADVFTLPSAHHETWGLVVNEAMNFGLPVVATDAVGCAEDLVHPCRNGFTVPHDDRGALADALSVLVDDASLRARFGAASREIVAAYNVERCADGIVDACMSVARGVRAATSREYRDAA
ncbi:MAG TPA: glycosyltransferase family 4 protein [Dehalococcoidia bacterium]